MAISMASGLRWGPFAGQEPLLHQWQLLVVRRLVVGAARQVQDIDECRLGEVLLHPGMKGRAATGRQRRRRRHRPAKVTSERLRIISEGHDPGGGQVTWDPDLDVRRAGRGVTFGQQDREVPFATDRAWPLS